MKAIPQLLAEARSKKIAEGVTEEDSNVTGKDCISPEHRLSVVSKLTKGKVTESRRITRNNGSGSVDIMESDAQLTKIADWQKRQRCSWQEASIMVTGSVVPEPGKTDELAAEWHRYCPMLKESEIATLVARKVPVPKH